MTIITVVRDGKAAVRRVASVAEGIDDEAVKWGFER